MTCLPDSTVRKLNQNATHRYISTDERNQSKQNRIREHSAAQMANHKHGQQHKWPQWPSISEHIIQKWLWSRASHRETEKQLSFKTVTRQADKESDITEQKRTSCYVQPRDYHWSEPRREWSFKRITSSSTVKLYTEAVYLKCGRCLLQIMWCHAVNVNSWGMS